MRVRNTGRRWAVLTAAAACALALTATSALAQRQPPTCVEVPHQPGCPPLQFDSAQFVSQNIPTPMRPGARYFVSITMKNSGFSVWTSENGYKLGSQAPQDNLTWGIGRVPVSGPVAPSQLHTFGFIVTAPRVPGVYPFQWRMVREGVTWFGAFTPLLSIEVADPSVQLIASYVPFRDAPRTEFVSTGPNPPALHFFYDERQGNFEQRLGGACYAGHNNPTYLMVRVAAPRATSCTFQASWDGAPIACNPAVLQAINQGRSIVLNTDLFQIDPGTCQRGGIHLPFNAPAWLNIDLVINGITHARRVNFIKLRPIVGPPIDPLP